MSSTTNHAPDPAAVDTDALNAVFAELESSRPTINAATPTRPTRTRIRSTSFDAGEPPSRNWLSTFFAVVSVVCLSIGLFKHFQSSSTPITLSAVASAPATPEFRTVTRNIEDFDVGLRVAGRNPLRDEVESLPEPDSETSRKLLLRMRKESGLYLKIKLLRSLDWIEYVGATEGGTFHLELPEMGAVGDAFVEAILPCPEIADRSGNIVTGVFEHEAETDAKILSVTFENGAHIKGVTDNHPFFSVDRNTFVAVGEMREGETVQINDGTTKITAITTRAVEPGTMLYNLETHNEHVFQVTLAGILVHNNCVTGSIRGKAASKIAKDVRSRQPTWKKLPSNKGHGWKFVDEADVERIRYMYPQKDGKFLHERLGYFVRKNSAGDFLDIDGAIIPPGPDLETLQHLFDTSP